MSEVAGMLSGAEVAPQRRYLSVLFADLSDSTRLGASLEAEVYAELLNRLRQIVRDLVKAHGGHVARLQGDGVLAIFGHPQPAEDDGQRAAACALALHAALRRLTVPGVDEALTLHSGIHSGMVLLGEGDVELGRFELFGNVPNVAARLSSLAGPDQILVSEETLGPRLPRFQTGERQLLTLKGYPLPLATREIIGHAPERPRLDQPAVRGLAPFVGRAAELARLQAAHARALAGQPTLVALEGGAGLGKTRLVEEFLRGLSGCPQYFGYCENELSAVPLQPFLHMLRQFGGVSAGVSQDDAAQAVQTAFDRLARMGGDLAEQRPELLRLLSLPVPPGQRRGNALEALQAWLTALLQGGPLVLVLDDWQWADDASQQVLSGLMALRAPLLVLVTTRGFADNDPLAARAERIALAPLGLAETLRAVDSLLPGAARFVTERIFEQAGGNPLFIEELCHSAAAAGAARWRLREGAGPGAAAWLSSSIEARVARLPESQAELVRAAAVVGNVVPLHLLELLLGRAIDAEMLRQIAEQDFIFPTEQAGLLRFKHGIAREAIYEAIGLTRRQALHLQLAAALAAEGATPAMTEQHEALAYHYGAGGDLAAAARYSELAGDKALAAYALDRARSQYCAALAALDKLGLQDAQAQRHWCEIVHKLGVPCVYDPLGIADALDLFRRGAELARASGDAATLARSLYWLGYICYVKGESREALRNCEAALAAARSIGDERLAAQVRATLGQVLCAAADYEAALAQLDDAIDAKREYSRGSRNLAVGSAFSLSCKGLALGDRGEFERAHECLDLALDMVGGSGHQVEASIRG
ncbi:MAG TPA: AAA family ATPase, partial [Burkholderiaceae bacterium]